MACIILLSEAALRVPEVKAEVSAFEDLIERDAERLLLPVRVRPCDLPPRLADTPWVDALTRGMDAAIDEVVAALTARATSSRS
jgi:hypothetical protein